MKAARGTYCLLPVRAIADRDLTKTALRVLAFMSLRANAGGEVYWSARRIGKTLRIDEREVRHAISLLKTRGHIVKVRGPGGDRKSVTYRIVFSEPKWPSDDGDGEGDHTGSRRGESPTPEVGGISREVGGVSQPGRGDSPPQVGGNAPYKLESELDSEVDSGRERGAPRASRSRSAKKQAHPIGDEWSPTDDDVAYARSKGLGDERIADEAERFRDHHLTKPKPIANWSAAWRTWTRNAADPNHFSNRNRVDGQRQSRSAIAREGMDMAIQRRAEDERRGIKRDIFGNVISSGDAAQKVGAHVVDMKKSGE